MAPHTGHFLGFCAWGGLKHIYIPPYIVSIYQQIINITFLILLLYNHLILQIFCLMIIINLKEG